MECFEEKILDQIQSNGLFEEIDRVLLAVSGGADSVAMAYALSELRKKQLFSCEFIIGHVNHCLRGAQSDADEAFVQALGQQLEIPVVTKRVDVTSCAAEHKLSIETAGRKLRIQALGEMADEYDCQVIMTAHHADDQAETIIHRLMRGVGYRGLCGIKPISSVCGWIYVRPMLGVRRSEIIEYCKTDSIKWREDASNTSLAFTRNRIRHLLLPSLKGQADLVELLSKLAIGAQDLQQRIDETLKDLIDHSSLGDGLGGEFYFSQAKLRNKSPWIFYEFIRNILVLLGAGLRDYSKSHFEAISVIWSQDKARTDFPGGIEIIVENGIVAFRKKECPYDKIKLHYDDLSITLRPDETVEFGSWRIDSRFLCADEVDMGHFLKTKDPYVEWFDANKIVGPLIVRRRQVGDRFFPIGGSGEKKVARFLQDAQLDGQTKQQAFIIKDLEKILWVAPVRMSDQFKITSETRQIVEIRISELKSHN